MTEKEIQALKLSGKLWNLIAELENIHPDDIGEYRRDINNIQTRLMARPEQRFQNSLKNENKNNG